MIAKSLLRISVRARARMARRWLEKIRLSHWEIMEISQKSGEYWGKSLQHLSDPVPQRYWSRADLLVFLELAEQSDPSTFSSFLKSLPNKRVLFSFSEQCPRFFGKQSFTTYPQEEIYKMLQSSGFQRCEIREINRYSKTKLVFAEKLGFDTK